MNWDLQEHHPIKPILAILMASQAAWIDSTLGRIVVATFFGLLSNLIAELLRPWFTRRGNSLAGELAAPAPAPTPALQTVARESRPPEPPEPPPGFGDIGE